jgi:antitoxin component YwqK of YwqJK toxin-antitoxin module
MPDKTPRNEKGQAHGYCEAYYNTGKIWFKTNYVNGELCGLCEWTARYGEINSKEYYAR